MIIAGLSDIHGKTARMDKLVTFSEEDVILLVGDITHFGRKDAVAKVVDALGHIPAQILAVAGNCDHWEVGAYLDEAGINLHGKNRIIGGIAFIGIGASLPTPFNTPYEMGEDAFERILAAATEGLTPEIPKILVSHQPPIHTQCDRLHNGQHVGSRSVRRFIEQHKPLACFTGHIHESAGVDRIGDTPVINPGPFGNGCYAQATVEEAVKSLNIMKL